MPQRSVVLATVFLLLLIVAAATRMPLIFAAYAGFAGFLLATNLRDLLRADIRERAASWLLIITMTAILPLATLASAPAVAHYAVAVVSLLCALVFARHFAALAAACRISLVLVQAGLIAYSLAIGLVNAPLAQLLAPHTSSNGVTSTLILMQATHSVLTFVLFRRTTLPTALATLVVCLLGYGRGSILASALILVVNLAFFVSWRKPWRTALMMVMLMGIAATNIPRIVEFLAQNTKIGVGFEDAPREKMIRHYLARMDGASALIGAPYRGTAIEEDFLGNPHNSYIRAHHLFGFFYLLALIAFPLIMIDIHKSLRAQIYTGLMLVIVLARAFTEPILFPTPFDFYFFSICLALNFRRDSRVAEAAKVPSASPAT